MKIRVCAIVLAMFGLSAGCFAQPALQNGASSCFANSAVFTNTAKGTNCPSPFQIRYFANLTAGDSFIDLTNDGSFITTAQVGGTTFNYSTGNICVNVYTFDPAEELVSCCSCLITPNGLVSLSAVSDLIGNTLTPASPTAITVKLLATSAVIQGTNPLTATQSCNPSFPFGLSLPDPTVNPQQNLAPAMHAWGTTLHAQPGGRFRATETEFSKAALGTTSAVGLNPTVSEINRITTNCGFIQSNGSGFGICKSCRAGGLGAVKQ